MLKKILYIFIVITLSAFLSELLFGIVFTIKDRKLEEMDIRDVPYLYYAFNDREGTNLHGFKTGKSVVKPDGKYRIILTGGSVARSKGDSESSIANKLENTLNNRLQTDVIEVVNSGVSGYVVQQEFLLIQMVLQSYEPDMIIGLDGFNDLYAVHLNGLSAEFEDLESGGIPPHNWKDFRVIHYNRQRKTFSSRLRAIFRNWIRAINFIKKETGTPSTLSPLLLNKATSTYSGTVTDIFDFCSSKGIRYFHFLQPARDYYIDEEVSILNDERLDQLYYRFEQFADERSYVFSLTGIFRDRQYLFTDFCHVNSDGNQVFADEIANRLIPLLLQDDQLYFKLKNYKSSSLKESE